MDVLQTILDKEREVQYPSKWKRKDLWRPTMNKRSCLMTQKLTTELKTDGLPILCVHKSCLFDHPNLLLV